MSLLHEQRRALLRTREFLRDLLLPTRPKKAKDLKMRAYACLRHFPFLKEDGEPMWSQDSFRLDARDAEERK